jgi:hypothetical protein
MLSKKILYELLVGFWRHFWLRLLFFGLLVQSSLQRRDKVYGLEVSGGGLVGDLFCSCLPFGDRLALTTLINYNAFF